MKTKLFGLLAAKLSRQFLDMAWCILWTTDGYGPEAALRSAR